MKIKEFRKKYREKNWRETTPQEDIMNEFYDCTIKKQEKQG